MSRCQSILETGSSGHQEQASFHRSSTHILAYNYVSLRMLEDGRTCEIGNQTFEKGEYFGRRAVRAKHKSNGDETTMQPDPLYTVPLPQFLQQLMLFVVVP